MSDNTKICAACKLPKSLDQFYTRGNYPTSECKTCMRARNKTRKTVPKTQALVLSEQILISKLHSLGIPALPGKAISHAHVDVVAWGIVDIEVKYSGLKDGRYSFITSTAQRQRGFLAHVVVLICDSGDNDPTFHLFEAKHPVFYMDEGQMKHAITYDPRVIQHKHESNRVVLTNALMESAQDNWEMIETLRVQLADTLRNY